MNEHGYLIRFRPFTWDENSKGEMIHNHYTRIDEFYEDEIDFRERVSELENGYFEDLDGYVYDGVDIDDMFFCELRRITS